MRVLIVDDEAPARLRLRQLLASHTDLEVAGEAETAIQAMELAGRLKPDLILLDIQMPGSTGIDVAACLPEPRPHIIFCTAFNKTGTVFVNNFKHIFGNRSFGILHSF